jgi:hypothetical protein
LTPCKPLDLDPDLDAPPSTYADDLGAPEADSAIWPATRRPLDWRGASHVCASRHDPSAVATVTEGVGGYTWRLIGPRGVEAMGLADTLAQAQYDAERALVARKGAE